jgi:hypothetical protein
VLNNSGPAVDLPEGHSEGSRFLDTRTVPISEAVLKLQDALTVSEREQLMAQFPPSPRVYRAWMARTMAQSARDAMGPFIAGLAEWQMFPTLTYDGRRLGRRDVTLRPHGLATHEDGNGHYVPRSRRARAQEIQRLVGVAQVRRDLAYYVSRLERRLRCPVAAVFAIEQHKSGALHVHGLVGFLDGQSVLLEERLHKLIVATQAWYRANGYARVEWIETEKDQAAIAAYCAKYMTKDISDLWFSRNLKLVDGSRSRPKP